MSSAGSGGTGEAPVGPVAGVGPVEARGFGPESLVLALDIARQCAEVRKQKEVGRGPGRVWCRFGVWRRCGEGGGWMIGECRR